MTRKRRDEGQERLPVFKKISRKRLVKYGIPGGQYWGEESLDKINQQLKKLIKRKKKSKGYLKGPGGKRKTRWYCTRGKRGGMKGKSIKRFQNRKRPKTKARRRPILLRR